MVGHLVDKAKNAPIMASLHAKRREFDPEIVVGVFIDGEGLDRVIFSDGPRA